MPAQHCTSFADIAKEKSWANTEQKDKIVQNTTILLNLFVNLIGMFVT